MPQSYRRLPSTNIYSHPSALQKNLKNAESSSVCKHHNQYKHHGNEPRRTLCGKSSSTICPPAVPQSRIKHIYLVAASPVHCTSRLSERKQCIHYSHSSCTRHADFTKPTPAPTPPCSYLCFSIINVIMYLAVSSNLCQKNCHRSRVNLLSHSCTPINYMHLE